MGPAGSGKSSLGCQYVSTGARHARPVTRGVIARLASAFRRTTGWVASRLQADLEVASAFRRTGAIVSP
jgi:hypothetical protein